MAAVELVMLLVFAEISAHNTAAQLAGGGDALGQWARRLGEYLLASVLPYAMPFVMALWLHHGLRGHILAWSDIVAAPVTPPAAGRAEKRRARNRRTL
jgi:hypothetical protein